jgi:LuxR family transcriptional regulator, quorum-sensing system regulator BjaR1
VTRSVGAFCGVLDMDFDFYNEMSNSTSLEEVGLAFERLAARHGYASSACRVCNDSLVGKGPQYLFRRWPADWARVSDSNSLSNESFTLNEARWRHKPFMWLEVLNSRRLTHGEQRTWNFAVDWGWKNGFVVPIHGPGSFLAVTTMASKESDLDLSIRTLRILQIGAILAFEQCRQLSGSDAREDGITNLSIRELDCLRWAAMGKTDWEIGSIMSITSSTVKFHIDRARTKLGASNRTHAVAMLMRRGQALI